MAEDLNKKLFQEAKQYIPGGVNSPVRSFKSVGGNPIFIKKAAGSRIYSEDGGEFIDYCMSFGALILGHTHPKVKGALKGVINSGTTYGAPTKAEAELAKVISEALPSIEMIRLTNSGTEAVMVALRLARAYSGKNKIIRFSGSYHGHADYLLNCPGIPADFTRCTLTAPYNDIEKASDLISKYRQEIAAIIVEPIAANRGLILPRSGFLQELRKITKDHDIILIFDEVITGFRLAYGGVQDLFNIKPDLTCLGKIIGGGLPIGAVGGRKEIMQLLAPEGQVYQAGTFSGNPVSVNAGLVTLKILANVNPYQKLERLTQYLCEGIKEKAEKYGVKIKVSFIGSMFNISFGGNLFKKVYHRLLRQGVYLAPSDSEVNFLSTAHTNGDIEKTLKAAEKAFKD